MYKYIPDTYNYQKISNTFNNIDSFVELQVKYKEGIENILNQYINLSTIDKMIENNEIDIPIINDKEYNFYHKFSKLNSNYVYLRNNIHIENLNEEEISILKFGNLTQDFFEKTLNKVLFEDGDKVFYGTPIDENIANSKSIVFEFAYNQKEFKNIDQLNMVDKIKEILFKYIDQNIKQFMDIPITIISYNTLPDLYYVEQEKLSFK